MEARHLPDLRHGRRRRRLPDPALDVGKDVPQLGLSFWPVPALLRGPKSHVSALPIGAEADRHARPSLGSITEPVGLLGIAFPSLIGRLAEHTACIGENPFINR